MGVQPSRRRDGADANGTTTRRYGIREATVHEAAPALERYVTVALKAGSRFEGTKNSPVEDLPRMRTATRVELIPGTSENK